MNQEFRLRGTQLIRNTTLNFAARVLPLIVMVFTVPYIIEGLGTERYGVLTLVLIVLGYFSILDLGLGRATTKFVAGALGKGESDHIVGIVWTSLVFVLGLGLMATGILIALTPLLVNHFFNVGAGLRTETTLVFYISAVGLSITLVKSTLAGVLEAYQRFDLINTLDIPSNLLSWIIPVLVLLAHGGLPVIVFLLVVKNFIVLIIYSLLCFKVMPRGERFFAVDMKLARSLFSFGGWLTLHNIGNYILHSVDQLLIGALLTLTALAHFSVPLNLVGTLTVLPSSMMVVLFPAFSNLQGSDIARLESIFWGGLKYLILLMGLPALVFMIFAEQILLLWLGNDFLRSVYVLQILAAGFVLASVSWHFSTLLQGTGHVKEVTIIALIITAFHVPLSWALITKLGIEGAAVAFTITRALVVIVFYRTCLKLKLITPIQFRIRKLAKLTGLILMIITATVAINTLTHISLWSVIFSALLLMAGYLSVSWHIILKAEDKRLLLQTVRTVLYR